MYLRHPKKNDSWHSSKFKLKSLQVPKLKDKNPDNKDCCKNGGGEDVDGAGEDVCGGG